MVLFCVVFRRWNQNVTLLQEEEGEDAWSNGTDSTASQNYIYHQHKTPAWFNQNQDTPQSSAMVLLLRVIWLFVFILDSAQEPILLVQQNTTGPAASHVWKKNNCFMISDQS